MHLNIETDRLILKTLDAGDVRKVLEFFIRNKEFLEEWEPERDAEFFTEWRQRADIVYEQDEMDAGRMLRFWVFKKGWHKPIGTVNFSGIVRGAFLSCFLGYRMDKDECGKGYITEAIRAGIFIMFGKYGLHRIEANIMPRNAASLRVAEKLGFEREGYARKYLNINGVWEDHIHMVLLNEEV